ncbi:MAG TPA: ABC transporter permease [Syntrophorhabdaceae bacterium]|nr:ABC transporter permease [Syntrophorhabdaceae bacterium]
MTFRDIPLLAIVLLLPVLICGIFGPLLVPHNPANVNPDESMKPPSWITGEGWSHVFGTDSLGRDVLSRVIAGAQATLIVSLLGVVLAGALGILLGLLAAYFGGWLDIVIMRTVDIQMSIPGTLLALLISASLGAGLSTIVAVIAIVFWTQYARVVRGETLSLKQKDFVLMAQVLGGTPARILRRHIFPNIIDSALVVATLQLGVAVMLEAALSFLGLGVQPPSVAWGKMIAESRLYIATAWWLPVFPGLAILMTVLGANLLGDWLRDRFDPKLRQL